MTSEHISHFSQQLRARWRRVGCLELPKSAELLLHHTRNAFSAFCLSFVLCMNHRRIRPKSTFVLLEESYKTLIAVYFHRVFLLFMSR